MGKPKRYLGFFFFLAPSLQKKARWGRWGLTFKARELNNTWVFANFMPRHTNFEPALGSPPIGCGGRAGLLGTGAGGIGGSACTQRRHAAASLNFSK